MNKRFDRIDDREKEFEPEIELDAFEKELDELLAEQRKKVQNNTEKKQINEVIDKPPMGCILLSFLGIILLCIVLIVGVYFSTKIVTQWI